MWKGAASCAARYKRVLVPVDSPSSTPRSRGQQSGGQNHRHLKQPRARAARASGEDVIRLALAAQDHPIVR